MQKLKFLLFFCFFSKMHCKEHFIEDNYLCIWYPWKKIVILYLCNIMYFHVNWLLVVQPRGVTVYILNCTFASIKKFFPYSRFCFPFLKILCGSHFLRGWNGKFLDSNKKLDHFFLFENNKTVNKYWQMWNNQKCQNNIKLH